MGGEESRTGQLNTKKHMHLLETLPDTALLRSARRKPRDVDSRLLILLHEVNCRHPSQAVPATMADAPPVPHAIGGPAGISTNASLLDFFASPTNDALRGNSRAWIEQLDPLVHDYDGADILERIVSVPPTRAGAYIRYHRTEPGDTIGTIKVYTGFQQYVAGLVMTPLDGRVYATLGDLVAGQGHCVRIVERDFDALPNETIPTTDDIACAWWDDHDWTGMLGNCVLQDPGFVDDGSVGDPLPGRVARVRRTCYLQHELVELLMDHDYEPAKAYRTVLHRARALDQVDNYRELLDFLLVCATSERNNRPASLALAPPPVPVLMTQSLAEQRVAVHRMYLPLPAPPQAPIDSIRLMTLLAQERSASRKDDTDPATQLTKTFGVGGMNLLGRLLGTDDSDAWPPIWAVLAGSTSANALNNLADAYRQSGGPGCRPIATPAHLSLLKHVALAPDNINDLTQGLQPFIVATLDTSTNSASTRTAEIQANVEDHQLVFEGGSVDLRDARSFREANRKIFAPNTPTQFRSQMEAYLKVLKQVLGATHTLTVTVDTFMVMYREKEHDYEGYLGRIEKGPSKAMRWIQIRVGHFLRDLADGARDTTAPALLSLLRMWNYQDRSWYDLELPGLGPRTPGARGGIVDGGPSDDSTLSTRGTGTRTGASQGGGAPRNGGAAPGSSGTQGGGAGGGGGGGTREALPAADTPPELLAFRNAQEPNFRIGNITAGRGAFPVRDDGTPMCLTYHVRGSCTTACARRADHGPHTPTETARLVAWCQSVPSP
ncbi:hypothetical protein MPSEU_000509600 [Mayamaea pseudoterrestris]|nr:hypothetical protein MPSEU_000509600 [Mayamaea pseudoterrestris]